MASSDPHATDRPEHIGVLVVGAGLSGIGAGYHLQTHCPGRSYAILEARDDLGGTWDLFRYPGVRSDSDMYTLGYSFAPWTDPKAIADGKAILDYVRATAKEHGIDRHIRFGHRVVRMDWSAADARWTVDVEHTKTGRRTQLTCDFLFMCSGYYDYAAGYTPEFPGIDRFGGTVIHPQHWPEDLAVAGKRIVVVGSGATAVTLVPALAEQAAHVTMLQRTPTYVISRPASDAVANRLRALLPERVAYGITRWKNVLMGQAFYQVCQRAPGAMKRLIMKGVREQVGDGVDVDKHFNPPYGPWDQRLCLVPDADLFEVLRAGRAAVVTDRIETFTEDGIVLASGATLPADIVVTATGLKLQLLGGATLCVEGTPVVARETMGYKAMMLSGVPNFALCFGYTNASWTLKADLTSEYVCRLLNHMRAHGHRRCVPRQTDPTVEATDFIDLQAGYVKRALAELPRAGTKAPWRLRQNYLLDRLMVRRGAVDDGVMEFS